MREGQIKAEEDRDAAERSFRSWAESHVKAAKYMNPGSGIQVRQLLFSGAANAKPNKKGEYLELAKTFKVRSRDHLACWSHE